MALHNGIDTVAIISAGVWSKTYGSADGSNIASLFVSIGLLEEAPEATEPDVFYNVIITGLYGIHSSPGATNVG